MALLFWRCGLILDENAKLRGTRNLIKKLTLEIVSLAGKRTCLALEVAHAKSRLGNPVLNKEVERDLRISVVNQCDSDNHDKGFALRLLNFLIAESKNVQRQIIRPSAPLTAYDIWQKAKALEKTGRPITHLEIGEPDFGPPDAVRKAMMEAVSQGLTRYTASAGIYALRKKVADHLGEQHNTRISADEVLITTGGRFALFLGVTTNSSPGDEVIIFDPSYPAYDDVVKATGATPVHVSTQIDNNWIPNLGELEDAINSTTTMIILNSPANPTGQVIGRHSFSQIVELAESRDISILSDEVYSDFSLIRPTSILQFTNSKHIYVNSFSKSYGMTGFRLGYAVSDKDTIDEMTKLQNLCLTSTPEFIQHAGIAALDCDDELRHHVKTVTRRLNLLSAHLARLPVSFAPPQGGFYVFPRIARSDMDGVQFAERLLAETGVCVTPGSTYGPGYSDCFRVSVCQPEDVIVRAVKAMEGVLQ